ncbi:MAG: exodeoxyribonuclease VII large subunit [Phycisphaerales bacterium]
MTGRLPFNPDRMKKKQTGERAGAGDDPSLVSVLGGGSKKNQPMSVSQLATRIEHAIKAGISEQVEVVGEISSLSHRTHFYFVLKDSKSVINAVLFASAARRLKYTPKHGDAVVAKGRVEYYAPGGRVSLIVSSLAPIGAGGLEAEFQQRANELKARGWFAPETKKSVPSFPRRIAVITSKGGAAIADVIDTASKRCPSIDLMIVDVRVQGAQAKGQITNAIAKINARADILGIDAIILTRGGGSLEDLWAFNEIEVAQAIHDSHLPIVAAIGHETDTTIAELVADTRCATPTQAAMQLTPDREALREQLISIEKRLARAAHGRVRYEQQRLATIEASQSLANPQSLLDIHRHRLEASQERFVALMIAKIATRSSALDQFMIRLTRHQPGAVHARREERLIQLTHRLTRTISRAMTHHHEQLDAMERELTAIGPMQVLSRGYSMTTSPDGTLIRSTQQAIESETIVTTFSEGKIQSRVLSENTNPAGPKKKDKAPSPNSPPDQFGLFS